MISQRRAAESRGRQAEAAVAQLWLAKGFDILAQRLRTQSGEIDLVVADPERLIFVEVKARKSLTEAAYSILPRQQARLLAAASIVLANQTAWQRPEIRFDVALVCNGEIEQIEDAIRYN